VNHGRSSDAGFAEQIDRWVRHAADADDRTFGDLVRALPGFYPSCVVDSLRRQLVGNRIPLRRAARLISQSMSATTGGVSSLAVDGLPVPHPLDFDWRFTDEAVEKILDEVALLGRNRGPIGVVGAPSVALRAGRTWAMNKVNAYDIDEGAVTALRQLGAGVIANRCNILTDDPPRPKFDVVITDPPWYFDDLCSSLWFCHATSRGGGFILASIPPVGTRPGIPEERTRLLEFSSQIGLELVRIESAQLPYRSPPFEQNALRAVGVAGAPVDWRRGDLAIFAPISQAGALRPCRGRLEGRPVFGRPSDLSFGLMREGMMAQKGADHRVPPAYPGGC
jgi:hypothetical protein